MRSGAVLVGCEHVADLEKLLLDGAEEVQAGLDLRLGVVRLHGGGDHRDEPALGGHLEQPKNEKNDSMEIPLPHLVGGGHHRHVNIRFPSNLFLWNDDLS